MNLAARCVFARWIKQVISEIAGIRERGNGHDRDEKVKTKESICLRRVHSSRGSRFDDDHSHRHERRLCAVEPGSVQEIGVRYTVSRVKLAGIPKSMEPLEANPSCMIGPEQ